MGRKKINVSDDELKILYIDKGLRIKDIAEMFDCSCAAVSARLKYAGVQARKPYDYPATDNQRVAWAKNGRHSKGRKLSTETRSKISASAKGRRKRTDYEFGGHEKKRTDGYVKVYVPSHPNCTSDGYVMQHILVMEKAIGRYIGSGECVHHINHIRDDNRIENLKLMTISEHMSMHMKERHNNRRTKEC